MMKTRVKIEGKFGKMKNQFKFKARVKVKSKFMIKLNFTRYE